MNQLHLQEIKHFSYKQFKNVFLVVFEILSAVKLD